MLPFIPRRSAIEIFTERMQVHSRVTALILECVSSRASQLSILRAPSQERADTTGGFEQSAIFNERHGSAGLLGFGNQ